MINVEDIEKQCPFKKVKWWDDLTYCQEFVLCECCPKYDTVIELIEDKNHEKEN